MEIARKSANAITAMEYRSNELNTAVADLQIAMVSVERAVRGNSSRTDATISVLTELRDAVKKMAAKLGADDERESPLPPMRPKFSSSVDFVERIEAVVKAKTEALAAKSPGPLVQATPAELVALTRGVVEEEAAKRETAMELRRLALLDEQKKRETTAAEDRAKERREDRRKIRTGVIVGIIMLVVTAVATYVQGHMTGRGEGIAEERASHAPLPVATPARKP